MEVLKEIGMKIAKLIDVKSLLTLSITGTFIIACNRGNIPQELVNIFLIIVGFYFGVQTNKTDLEKTKEELKIVKEEVDKKINTTK